MSFLTSVITIAVLLALIQQFEPLCLSDVFFWLSFLMSFSIKLSSVCLSSSILSQVVLNAFIYVRNFLGFSPLSIHHRCFGRYLLAVVRGFASLWNARWRNLQRPYNIRDIFDLTRACLMSTFAREFLRVSAISRSPFHKWWATWVASHWRGNREHCFRILAFPYTQYRSSRLEHAVDNFE